MRTSSLTATLVLALHTTIAAQTPVVPTPVKKGEGETATEKVTVTWTPSGKGKVIDLGEHPVTALSQVYLTGDGAKLNSLATEILETLACAPEFFVVPTGSPCPGDATGQPKTTQRRFNLAKDYVFLTWVGGDYSGKRTVYRIMVHQGLTDPYNVTLPGVEAPPIPEAGQALPVPKHAIYEVFLSPFAAAEHNSQYVFTAQGEPLEAQVPSFIEKATGPLFASAGKILGGNQFGFVLSVPRNVFQPLEDKKPPPPPPVEVTAMMSVVKPPMKRAKVKVNAMAKQPLPVEEFKRQFRDLASKLAFLEARQSVCATRLAEAFAWEGQVIAESEVCTARDAADCRRAFNDAFRESSAAQEASCRTTSLEEAKAELPSTPPSDPAVAALVSKRLEMHKAAMTRVDDEMRKMVASQQPERVTGESTFNNTPLMRWSFGALTSFIVKSNASKPRVKVGNDGKFASDPMPRQMTMFVVNFAPTGYDPDARSMSNSERFRPFAGVIATPDFGLGGGFSVGIWKGVGLNMGGGVTWVPSLRSNERFGDTPVDAKDPLAAARASVWFVGASYNFK